MQVFHHIGLPPPSPSVCSGDAAQAVQLALRGASIVSLGDPLPPSLSVCSGDAAQAVQLALRGASIVSLGDPLPPPLCLFR